MDDNNTFDNENRNHPEKRQNHKHGRHYKKRHNGGRPSGQPREKAEADVLTDVSGESVAEAVRDGSSAKQDAPQNRQKSRNGRNRKRSGRNRQKSKQQLQLEDDLAARAEDGSDEAFSLTGSSDYITEDTVAAYTFVAAGEQDIDDNIVPADQDEAPAEKEPEVPEEDRIEVVGVRFASGGKTYFFSPGSLHPEKGQSVIVETARGQEFASIAFSNKWVRASSVVQPLKEIIRLATEEDLRQDAVNHEDEKNAFTIGLDRIAAHKLNMKLVDVQYTFDRSKLLFYFTSESRVDFRELVKDLASIFHTRIELRQIGIRDEAKMLGGLGPCGRMLCCSAFLPDFAQVTIKMAKDQNLSLNSSKVSGNCGRLMCCLSFEYPTYSELLSKLPAVDSFVRTPEGDGYITAVAPLSNTVKVSLPDSESKDKERGNGRIIKSFSGDQIQVLKRVKAQQAPADASDDPGRNNP
ncbi:MAG: stage 0 sporulation family protein [Clostridia bacterium]|nr:stage 0 sporulation family protein [Clostridia bacterium]